MGLGFTVEDRIALKLKHTPNVRTIGCYACTREAGGDPMASDDQHPQRKVLSAYTTNSSDPTEVLRLECGHDII